MIIEQNGFFLTKNFNIHINCARIIGMIEVQPQHVPASLLGNRSGGSINIKVDRQQKREYIIRTSIRVNLN